MGVFLEVKSGPLAPKQIPVPSGQTVLIGRATDRAQFAVPQDNHMSGVHFAVECSPSGCRVIDKKSTNGTFLNGGRIQEAMLATGDEIKAGQTSFVVRIVPDDQLSAIPAGAPAVVPSRPSAPAQPAAAWAAPPATPPRAPAAPLSTPAPDRARRESDPSVPSASQAAGHVVSSPSRQHQPAPIPSSHRSATPPALTIGKWTFSKIPEGWQVQEGLGIQMQTKDDKLFPSNVGAMEEPLGSGITLPQYVEAQTKMFREYLREPTIDAALPPQISGAAEAIALEVRYSTKEGQAIYYRRVYVRSGPLIGVLTLTTLEKDLSSVRPAYDSFVAGAFFSAQN